MSLKIINDPGAHCTFNRQFKYELEWTPEKHYVPGTRVELRSRCLRAFFSWRYIETDMERADITYRWKAYPSVSNLPLNRERVVFRAKLPYGARPAYPLKIRTTLIPPIWAGIDERFTIWTIDVPNNFDPEASAPEPQKEQGSECVLPAVAGPVERFSVYCRPMPSTDGEVRACLVPEDRFGNPGRFERPVPVQLEWEGKTWTHTLSETATVALDAPKSVGRLRTFIPMDALSPRENISNGLRLGEKLVVTGNPVWPASGAALRAAFGEFHWHTEISGDGQRSMDDALASARDFLNMDFAAPGDHNPRGEAWRRTVDSLDRFNAPDEFATFYGWENGTDRGHENYYFTDPDHALVCDGSAGVTTAHWWEIADKLSRLDGFFAVPHHTNAVAETRKPEDDSPYWHPYPWGEPQKYVRAVEIMQARGNQERNDYTDAWRGWHQNNGSSVRDALDRGYKVGFTGGTDNHCGWPGRAYARSEGPLGANHGPKSVILTGVWTARVERQSIFDALYNRHSWAVWDTRALCWFTVNDALMGDEIKLEQDAELAAHIKLSAEDAFGVLEIVSDEGVVWEASFSERDIEIDVPLGKARRSTYYYLRGLLRNGGILYASPVFVEVKE